MSTSSKSADRIADHIQSLPPSGIRDFFEIVQSKPHVISLGVGEPDFPAPWRIREAAIYALERGRTSYTSNYGLPRLRKAIARYLEQYYRVQYDPNREILVTVGVSEALDLALRAFLNPGDEVLYHEPCYVSYAPTVTLAGGVAVPIAAQPENRFTLQAESVRRAVTSRTKVLILNFPTNPTGGILPSDELEQIAEVVKENDLLVLTDEIYSELTYEGTHRSIAAQPGMAERTIFLHGFSKAYAMTGFRIGYACGPQKLIEAMTRVHQYTMLCASVISQEAALEAIENAQGDAAAMKEQYRLRRNFVVNRLNEMGLSCLFPGGSFYAFPSVESTGLSSREFAVRLLEQEEVACVPGDAFGPTGEGYVRCCFATAFDQLEEAMDRMSRFVHRLPVSGSS